MRGRWPSARSRSAGRGARGTRRSCCCRRRPAAPTRTRASSSRAPRQSSPPAATTGSVVCWPGSPGSRITTRGKPLPCWRRPKCSSARTRRERRTSKTPAGGRTDLGRRSWRSVPGSPGSSWASATRRRARMPRRGPPACRRSSHGCACARPEWCATRPGHSACSPISPSPRRVRSRPRGRRPCSGPETPSVRWTPSPKRAAVWTWLASRSPCVIPPAPGTPCSP